MSELIIKKFDIDMDDEWTGIEDISYVYNPANGLMFNYFGVNDGEKKIEYEQSCFSSIDDEKREVVGCVLQSNKLIYRDIIGHNQKPGYLYCDRDTIRKMFKKYGWKKNITFKHDNTRNINDDVIKLNAWLEEDEEKKETRFMEKHKIISDKLWNQIKSGYVRGFSINLNYKLV